ncbi:hypothetical protein [Streptomyces sp. NPDC059409]
MDTTLVVNLGLHLVAALIVIGWIITVVRTEQPEAAPVKHEEGL